MLTDNFIKKMVILHTPDDLLGEGWFKDGNSAHHYACMEGNLECVKALLDGGATVDLVGGGMTALMYAADKGQAEIVKALLAEKGIDLIGLDGRERSPLMCALTATGAPPCQYIVWSSKTCARLRSWS